MPPRTEEERHNNVSARDHIEGSLNASLNNLDMDYVDLYIYHMWDYHTPMEDIVVPGNLSLANPLSR
ncbi:aldo/keto reductase [Aerococcus sp.]|uniref:aldo/keto reductase n=1 Tax=Aerococcus sp. TaxID=1872398 RepID=UPI0037C0B9B6